MTVGDYGVIMTVGDHDQRHLIASDRLLGAIHARLI